jgi:hypothetical protein
MAFMSIYLQITGPIYRQKSINTSYHIRAVIKYFFKYISRPKFFNYAK